MATKHGKGNRAGLVITNIEEVETFDHIKVEVIGDLIGRISWGEITVHFLDQAIKAKVIYNPDIKELIKRFNAETKQKYKNKKIVSITFEVLQTWNW